MPVTILNLVVSATVREEDSRNKVEKASVKPRKALPDEVELEQLVKTIVAEALENIEQENER